MNVNVQADQEVRKDVETPSAAVDAVRRVVRDNWRRWRRLSLVQSIGLLVAVPLAYLWGALMADNQMHFGQGIRLAAALGFLVILGGLVWLLVRRWRALQLSEDEVALAIERRTEGGIQNRLINAIQLARESTASGELGGVVVRENYQQLRQMILPPATGATAAMVCVGLAAVAILAGFVLRTAQREQFSASARRLLLPLAEIEPVYRTRLEVLPGNVQAAGDVTIRVRIHGERPTHLIIFRQQGAARASETIAVPRQADEVGYTFRNLRESLSYAVRGNDFTSPFYRITVNSAAELSRLKARLVFPEYTRLAPRELESSTGDLEALLGTKAEAVFVFDRPTTEAALLLQQSPAVTTAVARVALQRRSDFEFAGVVTFRDVLGYRLETRLPGGAVQTGKLRALRVLADAEPKPELIGLERELEVSAEALLPVKVSATDDIGLEQVGLFAHRLETNSSAPATNGHTNGWAPVQVWPANSKTQFLQEHALSVAALGAVEGDRVEVQARAADNDPLKKGAWTAGPGHVLVIGGEGTSLQLIYERILQTERDLAALIASQEQMMGRAVEWIRKFDPASGLRWDEAKTIEALAADIKDQAKTEEQIRQAAGAAARGMVGQAGDLRLSVGLLADTEMVRIIQMLEAVPGREDPPAKRAALADARLTQERTLRSLRDIADQYRLFRQDWELSNMIAFTGMLADRQKRMQEQAVRNAPLPAAQAPALGETTARRQLKVLELAGLASQAFTGMARRTADVDPLMIKAFGGASTSLAAPDLKTVMQQAADLARARAWAAAGEKQAVAAKALEDIQVALKKAQADMAKGLLAALEEKAKSSVEAQKELERLKAGSTDQPITLPANLKPEDIAHLRDVADAGKKNPATDGFDSDKMWGKFSESILARMQNSDDGRRQQLKDMSLAKTPTGFARGASFSDLPPNKVNAVTQDKLDDLIGKLLNEADIMEKQFDTFNVTMATTMSEHGDVGKLSGRLNSTAATAATGNQKPPPANVGGVSRSGRQGARSHGLTLSTEAENMRGRDKVQEGQERVADQAGLIRERKSEDPQKDVSTGFGGKKVQTDEPDTFNTSDVGKFDPSLVDKMGPAKEKGAIVERADGRVASNLGDLLRDMNSTQTQVVERLKAIRKELRNLYLPTEHLDDLLNEWNGNLARLRDNPDPEAFRIQQETLDKLRNAVRVFGAAQTGFQPSLPREQAVRGQVLDEAPRQVIPGYEDVVKTYYEMLSPPAGGAR